MADHELLKYTYFRGRVALYAILKALHIGKGDEVAIQAFTCVAVPEGVMATGATPLYIDIIRGSVNMDPADLENKISSKTKAIVVQHTFGIPAEIEKIKGVADKFGIPVIEDCCHAISSKLNNQLLGTFGVASFYSFEWGKPLVGGIGGSAIVNDKKIERNLADGYKNFNEPGILNNLKIDIQFHVFNILYKPSVYWSMKYLFHKLGKIGILKSNYNPISGDFVSDDFHLTMFRSVKRRIRHKLSNFEISTEIRLKNGNFYHNEINSKKFKKVIYPVHSDIVYARYPLFVEDKADVLKSARNKNIEISDWYASPAHPLTSNEWKLIFYDQGSCPVAESACKAIISLPTHEKTSSHDLSKIVKYINEV